MKISFLFTLITIITTYTFLESRKSKWYSKENNSIFDTGHYKQELFNLQRMRQMIRLIPKNANVSASNRMVPRLALRDKIYLFPTISDAQYLFVLDTDKEYHYPSYQEVQKQLQIIRNSSEWELLDSEAPIFLYRRKNIN